MSLWPVDPRKWPRIRSLAVGRHIRRYGWPIAAVVTGAAVIALAGTLSAHADRTPGHPGGLAERTGTGWRDSDEGWSQPATPPPSTSSTSRPVEAAPARFATLPPGAALPTGAQCATWVRARPSAENKRMNLMANAATGHRIGADIFDDNRADTLVAPRVDGAFTGSTKDILRWAACKWGVDEDLVFAQAAIESWWRQTVYGDYAADATRCAPGHGLGSDGRAGQCPESFGILQDRHPYQKSAWPGVARSTAMNADLAYAIWRGCFEGYEGWLGKEERGSAYRAGDQWGCVGRWYSGRWHTPDSEDYIAKVKDYLKRRIWETRDFQQP
ncbi:autotransporter family porin [Asanoa hainanensis]|uniref:Autotransporter family porin n=1 Tax=Asanoa hainanensis TaxID=560556 RepID=A0A239P395_9ACTN|nr:autotransporter family porin [Asanoa hainanensis]